METPANRRLSPQRWLSEMLAILLALGPVLAAEQAPAPQPPPPNAPAAQPAPTTPMAPLPMVRSLKVTALAGNHEANDLERALMVPLVVQVLDQNDRPVEGAEVVFRFPLNGPSATFRGGNSSQTVHTNGQGQAAATNWNANNQVGAFDVHVTASYGNQLGEATVSMTNATRVVEEGKKGSRSNRGQRQASWFRIVEKIAQRRAAKHSVRSEICKHP